MNDLILPESDAERQQAHERLISQLFSKTDLLLPSPSLSKEEFLAHLIYEYHKNTNLPSKFKCKYGWITNPVAYLESVKDEPWEMQGVMDFYFNHWFLRRSKELREKTKVIRKGIDLDYEINSRVSYLRREGQIWFDIRLEVGPFVDWDDYLENNAGVYCNLQDTVIRCLEHPDFVENILKEKKKEEMST